MMYKQQWVCHQLDDTEYRCISGNKGCNIHAPLSILVMGHKHLYRLFVCALLLLLCACSPPQKAVQVDHLPKELLESLKRNDLDKAMTFYSKEFFQMRPQAQWRERLSKLLKDNGPITTISFRNKQADTRFSGKFYIYQYDTVHGSKRIKHIITYVRPVDSDEVNLVGHKISG